MVNSVLLFNRTLPTPAENLALEEAMLESSERQGGPELLRFWECPDYFVVLGAGGRVADEANVQACRSDGIAILRRCSGGGTVLQGPGCLSYSLVLDKSKRPELETIAGANHRVLSIMCKCLSGIGPEATFLGTSDMCLGDRKFSGNAQKRKRRFILFHGTILYGFRLELIWRYLAHPPRQPEYRADRVHEEFVANFPSTSEQLIATIADAWNARSLSVDLPQDMISELVRTKYASAQWNLWR